MSLGAAKSHLAAALGLALVGCTTTAQEANLVPVLAERLSANKESPRLVFTLL
jgi:hypothetical protein